MISAPRFSPPPSDAGDRATSPALSSSSRTTTSIPTDLSDVSSLDGMDDYEVIEAPLSLTQGHDSLIDSSGSSRLPAETDSSVASEIDGSSFLAPAFSPVSVVESQSQSQESRSDPVSQGELRASTSLTTLHRLDQDVTDSNASSMLRFPDPLDESFQCDKPSSDASQSDHGPDGGPGDGLDQFLGISTPTLSQHFDREDEKNLSEDLKGAGDTPVNKPIGMSLSWNKKLTAENIFCAVFILIVIIVSTGLLPTWPSGGPNAVRQMCGQPSTSWLSSFGSARVHPCLEVANATAKAPKALMIKPSSDVGIVSSEPSRIALPNREPRPSGKKAGRKSRQPQKDCPTLSVHLADIQSHIKALCATVPTAFESVDPSVAGVMSGLALSSARDWSKTASQNAQALSTIMRKEYRELIKEMDERYSGPGRRLGSLMKPNANRKLWKQIQKQHSALSISLQRSWLEWMQAAHSWMATLESYSAYQTRMMQEDWEQLSSAMHHRYKKHSKQITKLARQYSVRADRMVKQAQVELKKGRAQAYKRFKATKDEIYRETLRRKELRTKRDVEKRLKEIRKLRLKHQELMALLAEETDLKYKSGHWLKKGKAELYRKAIQSIQAKHQLEDKIVGMMTTERLPQWTSKKGSHDKHVKSKPRQGKASAKAKRR